MKIQVRNILVIPFILFPLILMNVNSLSAEKVFDFTGTWEGSWESGVDSEGVGTFTLILMGQGSNLTGSLTVPDIINESNAPVKVTVKGNRITFGDVKEEIKFTGKAVADSYCYGTYEYPLYGDHGKWRGQKTK
jgi:hypothetical protein